MSHESAAGRSCLLLVLLGVGACVDSTAVDTVPGGIAPGIRRSSEIGLLQAGGGIWIGPEELATRPTTGAAWEALLADAARNPGPADIADQHSLHDTYTMAAALACVRAGIHCDKAQAQVLAAIGTEQGADWHSVSRNLGAYVIAADLMGLRPDGKPNSAGTRVHAWIASFLTRTDISANAGEPVQGARGIAPFHSGSNSAAQEGFAHAAAAAYVGDPVALDRSWDAFRTYSCDPGAPDHEHIDLARGIEYDWEHSEVAPCAVNPQGTTKVVPDRRRGAGKTYRIDGAIINDMGRGGVYQWEPVWTQYPWTGLQGYVPAALVLFRAGYPAFDVANRAVYRTHEYLRYLEDNTSDPWFDGVRGAEVIQLVNWFYGSDFPMNKAAVGASRTFGYTDWTHPVGGSVDRPPIASAGGPYSGVMGVAVSFDGSGSTDPDGDALQGFAWDFGDGTTGAGIDPAHVYDAAGSYTVALVVTDVNGVASAPATTTASITRPGNQPPVPDHGGPYTGTEGAPITFDGSGTTDPDGDLPLTFTWTFGDGASASGVQPAYAYPRNGSFTVSLVVRDAAGAVSEAATTTAAVANAPPSVNAGSDRAVAVGEPFTLLVNAADPGVHDAPWSFTVAWGDGNQTTGSVQALTSAISAPHTYTAAGSFTITVAVVDKDGGRGSDTLAVIVTPPPPMLVGAGDIASCSTNNDEATAKLLDGIPGTVMALGDNAYRNGTAAEYTNCYNPTWGRHKARTRPAPGERDHSVSGAAGYFGYFGAAAGDPGAGYYSYELGDWHVVVLNSEIDFSVASAQYAWLDADLAAHSGSCVIAYWHRPYAVSGGGGLSGLRPIWELLYRYGADVVVNAHQGFYERFGLQAPDGTAHPAGIRQFVVGTGGATKTAAPKQRSPNSQVLNSGTPGVLKLTLGVGSYRWEFIPIAGKSFTDTGEASCTPGQ